MSADSPSGAEVLGLLQRITTPQSIADGALVALTFDDTADRFVARNLGFDGPAGARTGIVVPTGGFYRATATVTSAAAVDEHVEIALVVAGIGAARNTSGAVGGTVTAASVSALVELAEGDIVGASAEVEDVGGGPHDVRSLLSLERLTVL